MSMAGERDIALTILACGSASVMTVLVSNRYGSMLMAAMKGRKNKAHRQKYEKAGDEAVPFHDPEQCA